MANIKTIALSGAETAVYISGQNCDIRNDGTDMVYASAMPGVNAGADGVLSIPAGGAAKLLDTGGAVYLLGTGSVQLCGNDYSEMVFKSAASASGGGGTEDIVARTAINTHAANGEIHLTAEEAIEAAATTISNPNILINSWFGKGVINQRGQSEYISRGYTVDMWRIATLNSAITVGTVTVTDKHINLASSGNAFSVYFRQHIENGADLVGKTVTLSFKATNITGEWGIGQYEGINPSVTTIGANGIASVTFEWAEQTNYAIQLFNRTANAEISGLEWIKFEIGSVATPFVPPDPATELAKCQRYFYALPQGSERAIGSAATSSTGYLFLPLPTSMRITPTISRSDGSEVTLAVANGSSGLTGIPITNVTNGKNGILLAITGEFSVGMILIAHNERTADNSKLPMFLSAEL